MNFKITDQNYREKMVAFASKLKDGLKESQYVHFSFAIETGYKCGSGWINRREEQEAFRKFVRSIPAWLGYTPSFTVEVSQDPSICDSIVVHDTPTNVYCHPTEFSGIATREELRLLQVAVGEFYPYSDPVIDTLYNLPAKEEVFYPNRLIQLMPELMQILKIAANTYNGFNKFLTDFEQLVVPTIETSRSIIRETHPEKVFLKGFIVAAKAGKLI